MIDDITKKINKLVYRYVFFISIFATSVILFSLWVNIKNIKDRTYENIEQTARTNFNKDLAFRLWGTSHGGVYVKPTQKTPPSPWMAHIEKRDVVTSDGDKLTLMNPAYMIREMMTDFESLYGIQGRIVGIKYLNPDNKATPWETSAIKRFEKGTKEISEVVELNGEKYFKYIRPMVMEQGCQKCHGHLGYPNGSIRGAIGVSVPLKSYLASEQKVIINIILTHLLILFIGLGALFIMARRAKRQLLQRENDLDEIKISSMVFDNTIDGVLITDAEGIILRVNEALVKLTGYTKEELLGHNPRILKSHKHDSTFYKNLWKAIKQDGVWQGEIWNRKKTGEIYVSKESISVVKDSWGAIRYIIAIMHDVTQQKNYENKITDLAHYDLLTKLPNRVLFYDRFEHAILRAKRENRTLALLFLDLDGFKKINDTKGHPTGDQLLVEITKRLQSSIRKSDTIARLGGDEFTIVIEEYRTLSDLITVIENILKTVSQEIIIHGDKLFVSASIGVSVYPDDGLSSHDLIKHADTAMYKAKEDGKNRYSFYESAMTQQAEERVMLENSIRDAINNEEFLVYYQPKVCIQTNKIVGMEALVRWEKRDGMIVAPDKFIPVAEELNIIDTIDMYVLRRACLDTLSLKKSVEEISVAVNFSGYNVTKKECVQSVQKILDETGFNPELLELEITETYFINFDNECINRLKELKEIGIKLSIDDFGTGYSSLGNLKKLPVEILKIDKSFISILQNNTSDYTMVQSIIEMAHSLNLTIVAEGVEEKHQFNFLQEFKCDYVQGYYISKPITLENFKMALKKYNKE